MRQVVEITMPADLEPEGVLARVLRGGELVGRAWAARRGGHCRAELRLLPGSYSVTVEAEGRKGQAEMTVADVEGPPARIVLR